MRTVCLARSIEFLISILLLSISLPLSPALGSANKDGRLRIRIEDRPTTTQTDFYFDDGKAVTLLHLDETTSQMALQYGTGAQIRWGLGTAEGGFDKIQFVTEKSAASRAISGTHKLVAVLVDFTDYQASSKYTIASTNEWLYGSMPDGTHADGTNSVNGFYKAASFGNIQFDSDANKDGQPDIIGPIVLNTPMSCDLNAIASAVNTAVAASGVNLNIYHNELFILPDKATSCGWGGVGEIGCPLDMTCRIWLPGENAYAVRHELGHNLGMGHSGSPTSTSYGDLSCPMGGTYAEVQFNAPHMDQMGWMVGANPEAAKVVSESGLYTIGVYADTLNSSDPKYLKVVDPGTNQTYYVSYRQKQGLDTRGMGATYTAGISVHQTPPNWRFETTMITAVLAPGQSFQSPSGNLKITADSLQVGQSAAVKIELLGNPCIAQTPTYTLTPTLAVITTGRTAEYSLNVANLDKGGCSPRNFAITAYTSPNFTTTITEGSFTLNPGESKVVPIEFATDILDGTFGFSLMDQKQKIATAVVTVNRGCKKAFTTRWVTRKATVTSQRPGVLTFVVANPNSAKCSNSVNLDSQIPSTLSGGAFSRNNFLITGGKNARVSFTVNATTAKPGTYPITIRLSSAQVISGSAVVK